VSSSPTVVIHTDGACSGNPGPGGWGAILIWNDHERELSGGEADTTNNRMELMSVIMGLAAITRPMDVVINTDSAYVEQAFTRGWLDQWQRNGWRTASKQAVKNQDLWQRLAEEAARHNVGFKRVRGHTGVELNERADQLAVAERDRYATV
jgi:ribonuclease HI